MKKPIQKCIKCGKYPAEEAQTWCEFCLGISEPKEVSDTGCKHSDHICSKDGKYSSMEDCDRFAPTKPSVHKELKVLEEARYQSLDEKRAVIDSFLANKIQELEGEVEKLRKDVQRFEDTRFFMDKYTVTAELDPECLHNGCNHEENFACNLYCPHCQPRC